MKMYRFDTSKFRFVIAVFSIAYFAVSTFAQIANQEGVGPLRSKVEPQTAAKKPAKVVVPSDIVISVNGVKITKAEYERYIRMLFALFCHRNPNVEGKKKEQMRHKIRKSAPKPMIQRLIVKTKLADMNVDSLPEVENRLKKEYERTFGGKGKKFVDIQKYMEKQGFKDLFERDFALDVKLNSAFATVYSNELAVTDAEVAEVKKNVAKYNERAAATNALNEVWGAKLVKMARAKDADFAILADKYSQDPDKEKGGLLGERSEVDYKDEAPTYWRMLKEMKEGEVSNLIMTSDGYEILKVNRRISANDSNSGEFALNLSRIFLRRAYEFPEQSDEDFRDDIIHEKREKFFKDFLNKLVKESKIDFPSGTAALR